MLQIGRKYLQIPYLTKDLHQIYKELSKLDRKTKQNKKKPKYLNRHFIEGIRMANEYIKRCVTMSY